MKATVRRGFSPNTGSRRGHWDKGADHEEVKTHERERQETNALPLLPKEQHIRKSQSLTFYSL